MNVFKKLFNRDDPFLIQFALLSIFGFWFIDSKKIWANVLYSIYRFFTVFLITSLFFIELIDIVMLNQDLSNVAERLCAAAITGIITARTHLMLRCTDIFYKLQEKLNEFRKMKSENPEDLKIIHEASCQIVKAAKVFYVGAVFGVFLWSLHPKLYGDNTLPFPIRLPIDTEQSPYYEILYVYLTIILIMFTASVVATILGFGSYLAIINAHFQILMRSIETIASQREEVVRRRRFLAEFNTGRYTQGKYQTQEERELEEMQIKDAKTMEILKDAIETQKFIYDEIDSYKRLQSQHLLVHILGIVFGVSVVETTGMRDALSVHMAKTVVIVILGVLDVFLICLFGEELQHKSCQVADTLYMAPWHEMSMEVQKVLLIIIIRSHRPCVLKAGGTIRLNLATFLNIMRVAYNLVLLLRHSVTRNT